MAKVLIIDDTLFMRGLMADIVEGSGHQPIQAGDGIEGLEAIERDNPDLVFLDLSMPRMDGFGVLKALREKATSPPVIVLSADIQPQIKERVLNLGAMDFMNKPPDISDVVEAMEINLSDWKNAI